MNVQKLIELINIKNNDKLQEKCINVKLASIVVSNTIPDMMIDNKIRFILVTNTLTKSEIYFTLYNKNIEYDIE